MLRERELEGKEVVQDQSNLSVGLVIESWSLLLQKALPQEMTNQQHLPKECLLSKLFCNSTLILEDDQES